MATYAVFLNFPQYWLKLWTESNGQRSLFYVLGYFGCAFVSWISTSCLMWSALIKVAPRSGFQLHQDLLETIMGSRLSYFFDKETGVTLNRFGQDIQIVDKQLPLGLPTLIMQIFKLVVQTALLLYVRPILTASLPLLIVIVYLLQKYYLKVSRVLRFQDLESRAQIFTFIETTEGLSTIRALGWQEEYAQKSVQSLHASQRPFYCLLYTQRWLKVILDLLIAAIAVIVVLLTAVLKDGDSGAKIRIALNMVIAANATLLRLISSWTSLEISIGAVSRLKEVHDTTSREELPERSLCPDDSWPTRGELVLKDVQVSYNEHSTALREVNIHIQPGQKVLVCGRTGSGKSTLLLTLLRLLDADKGSIYVDDIDLVLLPHSTIRERCFITIPQDPIVYQAATLRFNIDPFEAYTDEQIVSCLEATQLWIHVLKGQIEAQQSRITSTCARLEQPLESFPPLTPGQLQLLSVSRAILRTKPRLASIAQLQRKKILLLDEITSSLDPVAEALVQDLVQVHFTNKGHTVTMIAHRLGNTNERDRQGSFDKMSGLIKGESARWIKTPRPKAPLHTNDARICSTGLYTSRSK